HDHPSTVVNGVADRVEFMSRKEIPDSMRIWIGTCGAESWQSTFFRYSSRIPDRPDLQPNSGNNLQSVAFGIGNLFVYVFQNRSHFPMEPEILGSGFVAQVFP